MASSPITDKKIIEQIKQKYLNKNQMRDLLLFLLSINTGIKPTELLKLSVSDIKNKDLLKIQEAYTKNKKEFSLENRKAKEPLFISIFGKAVDRMQVFRNFKEICVELGVGKECSVSSWRKTFGHNYYIKYGDLPILKWIFNQSTVAETLKFIGMKEKLNSNLNKEFCL